VSRFLTAHQHNKATRCYSRWFMLENTGQTQLIKDTITHYSNDFSIMISSNPFGGSW